MFRVVFGLGVVAALVATAGCRMCSHPYDYCGPVHFGQGCQSCLTHSRAGSILGGETQLLSPRIQSETIQGETVQDGTVLNGTQVEMQLGDVSGSEQIISVTDRVVEPSMTPNEPSQIATGIPTKPLDTLPSGGWTARRPTSKIQR